jgi:hypothetical protein
MARGRNAGFVLLLLMSGCAVPNGSPQAMIVELDIFSGRPNPTWEFSKEQTDEFASRLTDLPPCDRALAIGGLGYRGFEVRDPGERSDLPARIRIQDGFIYLIEDDRTRCFEDKRGIEPWLIEQAEARGFDILDHDG